VGWLENSLASATQPAPKPGHPGIVVLVDNAPADLQSMRRMLEPCPFSVATCCTPYEAIDHVIHGNVVVVVSEVSMSDMSGVELSRTIRQFDAELPFVLVTRTPSVSTASDAIEYGAFSYLKKPIDPKTFRHTVDRAGRLYGLTQAKHQAAALLETKCEPRDLDGVELMFEQSLESLWMAFQPIVRLSDHTLFGYEALLRSNEPLLCEPEPILVAAERLGELPRLGRTIRDRAAQAISKASNAPTLFVNLHPQDLLDSDLHDERSALSRISDRVVLEITERNSISTIDDVRGRIGRLRDRGFRIAVDDLGAGYSGLNSFALLEPEFVKLDMTLIRDIDTSPVKQKLAASMTKLCNDLDLHVVAEGVETIAERDTLVSLGCDLFQGFLFARPGPPFPETQW
jgi:EAL domain-containing protein (putative c-di-GMP-specific phosphodiesterase class I)